MWTKNRAGTQSFLTAPLAPTNNRGTATTLSSEPHILLNVEIHFQQEKGKITDYCIFSELWVQAVFKWESHWKSIDQYRSLQRESHFWEFMREKICLNYLKNHSQKTVEAIKIHLVDQALQKTAMREDKNQVTTSCSALVRKQIAQSQTGRHTARGKFWPSCKGPSVPQVSMTVSSLFSNSVFALPRVHSHQLSILSWPFPNSWFTQLKADREATTLKMSETPWNHMFKGQFKGNSSQHGWFFSPVFSCIQSNLALGKAAYSSNYSGTRVLALSNPEKKKQLQ